MARNKMNWRHIHFRNPRAMKDVTQSDLPAFPGVYVFTKTEGGLDRHNVLYVGIAGQNVDIQTGKSARNHATLQSRCWGYFSGQNNHTGAIWIKNYRRRHGGGKIFYRCSVVRAPYDPRDYEGPMINELVPPYNTRRERDHYGHLQEWW